MEILKEKTNKQENSLTQTLRTLIKQKEESLKKAKLENQKLQSLLFKQQCLLNKLNEDNMKLNKKLQLNTSRYLNDSNQSNNELNDELIEQNKSLKEQLLLSQNYGARMLKDLNEVKKKLKFMSNIVHRYQQTNQFENKF